MPGPSHDWHGRVSNGGKSSHLKRLHRRKIAADVETDHDDDLLDDGWPQANQRHEATPFSRKTTAPIRPDDAHRKDTCQVRNKTPFPGRAMKETNTSYVEEEASNSDEVDRSEGLGAADELPTLGKRRPAELIEFTAKIKDGSEHQGDDHLRSLPIAQDAPPNPVGCGNKRPEVRLKPSLKQGGQARINPGCAKQDVAQPHSATASKGHRIPLRNGKGTDSKSGQRQLVVSSGDGMTEGIWKSPRVRRAPARPDADVPSPPSK
ncbi:hypothetical protein BKA82DRAFT_4363711 [Pisolithus tinctorius]|nr:hypothetical protein BKA82DRAFT_4363711 [Pisolithus tinctorius]